MKTNNIYIAMLRIVISIEKGDSSGYCLYGVPIYDYIITSKPLKPVLVLCKKDKYGNSIAKDLNTKEQYSFEASSEYGNIFVNSATLCPFNLITDKPKRSMSKIKILKIGNKAINEITKQSQEEENK